MKFQYAPYVVIVAACAALAGCSSAPVAQTSATPSPAQTAVAPVAIPEAAPVPVTQAPVAAPAEPAAVKPSAPSEPPPPPPKLSAETLALVARLTAKVSHNALPHDLAETTSFPEAMRSLEPGARAPRAEAVNLTNQPPPEGLTADGSSTQLVVRDWTGLVLVPISTSLSKAYTSEVRLLKVEAHPLNDGRVRVWTRIHNIGDRTLPGQVACSFRMRGEPPPTSPYYYNLQVPAHSFRDVFFISPDGELTNYTVLVRSEDMKSRR